MCESGDATITKLKHLSLLVCLEPDLTMMQEIDVSI
jgi:hypothetical protein